MMNRPLLGFVGLIAAGGVAVGVYVALPDGGEDELLQPIVTATAEPTVDETPLATPLPSASAIPNDWLTYTDPGGLFTLRYPPTWFAKGYSLYSYDPSIQHGISPRPEAIEVELGYQYAKGSSTCGPFLIVDPETGEALGSLPGVTPANLGGVPAWEIVRNEGDETFEGNFTRIHGFGAIHSGYCILVAASFTQAKPDSTTVLQIVASYRFLDIEP